MTKFILLVWLSMTETLIVSRISWLVKNLFSSTMASLISCSKLIIVKSKFLESCTFLLMPSMLILLFCLTSNSKYRKLQPFSRVGISPTTSMLFPNLMIPYRVSILLLKQGNLYIVNQKTLSMKKNRQSHINWNYTSLKFMYWVWKAMQRNLNLYVKT